MTLAVGAGSFFRLAHGDEAGVEAIGESRAKDKSASLDAEHEVDFPADVVLGECVNELSETLAVFQQTW